MEARVFQYTLETFLQQSSSPIDIHYLQLKPGDIIEINYSYVHSKSLLLAEMVKTLLPFFDLIIFFNMSQSFDFSEVPQNTNLLIYNIFSVPEFFMYMLSLESFLKDCKKKTLIIIDSWNTYLWNDKAREGLIDHTIEKKLWEIIEKLQVKFLTTTVICKKSSISQRTIRCNSGVFGLNNYEKHEKVHQTVVVLEPIISDNGTLLHALTVDPPQKIYIFTYPFHWKVPENLQ